MINGINDGFKRRPAFLPFSPPQIGEEEIAEVVDTLKSGWITTGPKVKRFEEEFAEFVGAPAALAVNSATSALAIALAVHGIRPGDEVITTSMTFCSTAHVIEQAGATPVLVDVEPDTLNININQVKKAITENTRAILPVHLYGHPCEMDKLQETASRFNLKIIEDAAHALPASYKGRRIGGQGSTAAFSFYATKNITTGEGGMLTGENEFIKQARVWSLHGMSGDAHQRNSKEGTWKYDVVLPGFKSNMTDIQAAMGLHQLRRLPSFQARRQEVVRRYNSAFANMAQLQPPVERNGISSAWHLYVIRLNLDTIDIDRDVFIAELRKMNVGTSVHFIPLYFHTHFRNRYGYKADDYPVATSNFNRIITLPLHPGLTDEDVDYVIAAIKYLLECHSKT
ncbi:MAG: DegT/DnrJ/EryC1/StrS aminotransferase family protein [Actinobacteria bacterium]|nr:DegT/DnrJ/EryC1/StrS aminotransferase family protein [Actinomycetota bacterium]